jgi:hypothetical protein
LGTELAFVSGWKDATDGPKGRMKNGGAVIVFENTGTGRKEDPVGPLTQYAAGGLPSCGLEEHTDGSETEISTTSLVG